MTFTTYLISAVLVFIFSGLMAMAGLGAVFMFVSLYYYLGVLLAEATPSALLLNVVSLLFAAVNYWRSRLVNWRVGLPVLLAAVILSPIGARLTPYIDKQLLLALTLIDNITGRSVRVVTRPETIQRSKESEFIGFRKQGIPASKIDSKFNPLCLPRL